MIELNGIQISDNNINTKKNVKIYVDEKQLDSKVGELSDLKTTNKSSIVNAINEIKNTTDTLQVDVNRIYSDFTIIPNTPTEQEFTYKKSDEGVIEKGVAVIDKVKGNSVVWNQKVKNATFINTSEWYTEHSTLSVSGGIASVTASADGDNYIQQLVPMVVGHKYLYILMAATDTANKNLACAYIFYGEALNNKVIKAKDDTNWHTYNAIVTCVSNTRNIVRLEVPKVGTSQFKNISLIDLTQMFGADNEPSTYEEFLSRKPKIADEYAYNEGTIVNNKVEGVKTTGINLWDEEWELGTYDKSTGEKMASSNQIRSKNMFVCLPHASYYWKIPNKANGTYMGYCLFYDISGAFISALPIGPSSFLTVTTPSNARFVAFHLRDKYGTTYNHDICINLSDPNINGKYFPYEKQELDLSWVKEIKDAEGVKLFEDGLKSVGTAFDEVGKNKAVKRIRVVDLGELEWQGNTAPTEENGMMCRFFVKPTGLVSKPNYSNCVLSPKFSYSKDAGISPSYNHTCFQFKDGRVFFNIAVSEIGNTYSPDAMRIYMQGVPLYYELAEPIEAEYDEKNLTYPVIAGGTEEAIASEPSTPMRASITYGSNTVATILSLMNRVNELERKITN